MDDVSDLADLIADASAIMVVTGAGVSTASGIPDFRGPNGVWKTQRPVEFDGFLRDPRRRREYWQQKLASAELFRNAVPNDVHFACADLEHADRLDMVVTQNVDGLHSDAGTSAEKLVEVHGTARLVGCLSCFEMTPAGPHFDQFAETEEPPVCHCGGLLKSATISFGQALDPMSMHRASEAAGSCDLVISLGSTLSVFPVSEVPLVAADRGVPYAIVNMGATAHDNTGLVTLRIDGDVSEVFPLAVAQALAR
jgi:NAD-dependent deacetylase